MHNTQNDCSEYEKKVMECDTKLTQRNTEYDSIKQKQIDDATYN